MNFLDEELLFWIIFVLGIQLKTVELSFANEVKFANVKQFVGYNGVRKFNNLAIHRDNGKVYIGAVNRLYQLSPDLELQANISTGPVLQSKSPRDQNKYTGIWTNNYNKILVIDYFHSRLISCGSVAENPCVIYSTKDNISESNGNEIVEVVNAINANSSTVAFGNELTENINSKFALYVAQSHEYSTSKYSNVSTISIKVLHEKLGSKMATYKWKKNDFFIKPVDENFRVHFVYGFRFEKYIYFFTILENSMSQECRYISTLIRTNHTNDELHSSGHKRIRIECTDEGGQLYDSVQVAHVGKPGSQMAKSLNITSKDNVLFAIFSTSHDKKYSFSGYDSRTAVCIYSLPAINKKLDKSTNCNLDQTEVLSFKAHTNCTETSHSLITFNTFLTAINTTENGNYTDIFIGTYTGHIKKIVVENATTAYEQVDIPIDEGSPVNSDLLFSRNKNHLYVMTEHKLTKISILGLNCSIYTSYDGCLKPQHCGWCRSANKCTMEKDCVSWYRYDFRKNTSISKSNVNEIRITESKELKLYYDGLSHIINDTVFCSFHIENNTWTTNATLHTDDQNYNIHCPVPQVKFFLSLLQEYHSTFKLTVSISTDHISDIARKTFSLTFCNQLGNYKSCVFSTTTCQWCTTSYKCIHDVANECQSGKVVRNKSKEGNFTYCNGSETTKGEACGCPAYLSIEKCILSAFSCYWCSEKQKCVYEIEKEATCPNAPASEIFAFSPKQGPWEGGTNVNILGQNLNVSFDEIDSNIKVAGRPCKPLKENYVPLKKITCIVGQSTLFQAQERPLKVFLNKKPLGISQQNFTFVNPEIDIIYPNSSPTYGGTEITIQGKYLNSGNAIKVLIGNIPCKIYSMNLTNIKCITGTSSSFTYGNSNSTTKAHEVVVNFNNITRQWKNNTFLYFKDLERDDNGFNLAPKGIISGGVEILIRDINSKSTKTLMFRVFHKEKTFQSSCEIRNDSTTIWSCKSPPIENIDIESIDEKNPKKMKFALTGSKSNSSIINIFTNDSSEFSLYPDPEFHYFLTSNIEIEEKNYIIIRGRNINWACQKTDITVQVGNDSCEVLSLSPKQVICTLSKSQQVISAHEFGEEHDLLINYEYITIQIGEKFKRNVPKLQTDSNNGSNISKIIIYVIGIIFIITVFSFVSFHLIYRKKVVAESLQKFKKMRRKINNLELCVASECKEAFAELQTQITTFTSHNPCDSLPFLDCRSYKLKFLFLNVNNHSIILNGKAILIHKEKELQLFGELIMNKQFLLSFVKILEKDQNFVMNDRVYVASMLMMTLQKNMEYCTDILKTLMIELIKKHTQCNSHPKLLFRRTESVAEKMLSTWFAYLLHKFLRETAGNPLINLFSAIKQQVNKGPVDMITSDARYCLSESKLIRQKINYHPLTMLVNVSQQTASIIRLQSMVEKFQVNVLDCDTITQVKEKIMDAIYPSIKYSQRPNISEICIEWYTDTSNAMILFDNDHTSKVEGNWRQKNTLRHYGIPDNSTFNLISVNEANHRTSRITNNIPIDQSSKLPLLHHGISKKKVSDSTSTLIQGDEACSKEWHLIEPFNPNDDPEVGNNQIVPEIYLNRLLALKNSLQNYVNDLFKTIFKTTHQNNDFPIAIKYMFDFLDDQALQHGITDPEVVHIWKNNCLSLRFWVNLIKNPDFLFDVYKSNTIDSCLSVIAQILMDSCSTAELYLNKDSATSKLLYAKEIPYYKQWVEKYYADIKDMPKISPQDMSAMLRAESHAHAADFDMNVSVYELYKYAAKYKEKLIAGFKDDELVQGDSLVSKLEKVLETVPAYENF